MPININMEQKRIKIITPLRCANASLPSSGTLVHMHALFHDAPQTQPMAGAMYATRHVRYALNNQLVFIRTQRSDGRYAHRVNCGQVRGRCISAARA